MTNFDIADLFGIKTTEASKVLKNDDEILAAIQRYIDHKKPLNKTPYSRYEPCLCGTNRRDKWFSTEGVKLVCKNCGLSVSGNNEADAKRRWNNYMKEGRG